MAVSGRICKILTRAECGVRDTMQSEISAGNYSQLPMLASIAEGLAGLIAKAGPARERDRPDENLAERQPEVSKPQSGTSDRAVRRAAKAANSTVNTAPTEKTKYPFYEVGDDSICKVGWSKKSSEEYRHYAPMTAAKSLAGHIDKTQIPGHAWTVEELGCVVDSEAGNELPSYQIYLAIGWMRFNGLLLKQGRSRYAAVGGGEIVPNLEKLLRAK